MGAGRRVARSDAAAAVQLAGATPPQSVTIMLDGAVRRVRDDSGGRGRSRGHGQSVRYQHAGRDGEHALQASRIVALTGSCLRLHGDRPLRVPRPVREELRAAELRRADGRRRGGRSTAEPTPRPVSRAQDQRRRSRPHRQEAHELIDRRRPPQRSPTVHPHRVRVVCPRGAGRAVRGHTAEKPSRAESRACGARGGAGARLSAIEACTMLARDRSCNPCPKRQQLLVRRGAAPGLT